MCAPIGTFIRTLSLLLRKSITSGFDQGQKLMAMPQRYDQQPEALDSGSADAARNDKVFLNKASSGGFTLVEMVLVIVVLSILALGTTRYIVTSSESFVVSAERAKLIASGRVAVEQITRHLRNALPHSIRISNSGRCLEYFPVSAGSFTINPLLPGQIVLDTAPFTLAGSADFAVIAPFSSAELYVSGPPTTAVIATVASTTANKITLASAHTFPRESLTRRVYLVASPERFCVTGSGNLEHYTGYGIDTNNSISDSVPSSSSSSLMATNLDSSASSFVYSAGSLTRNAVVEVNLSVRKGDENVALNHKVQIRNVP